MMSQNIHFLPSQNSGYGSFELEELHGLSCWLSCRSWPFPMDFISRSQDVPVAKSVTKKE